MARIRSSVINGINIEIVVANGRAQWLPGDRILGEVSGVYS